MEREVNYHPKATAEAFKSARFYNRRAAGLGAEFFDELDFIVNQLRADPMRRKPDGDGVRSWRFRRFPFRVHFYVEPKRIRIFTVAHLKRRPRYWRKRIPD
jgi:toxin ParE1/3/4